MTVKRFLVAGACVWAASLAAFLPLRRAAGDAVALGVAGGAFLAALGAAVWLAFYLRARGRDNRAFLRYFLGGVFVRLLGMGAATLLAVAFSPVNVPSFIASLFGFYVVYQILEILLVRGAGSSAVPNGGPVS